jgi:lipopolysaccharide transport system permease protein
MALDHDLQRKIDLLLLLTRKEFTLKYKRTVLGIFWSLLNPILLAIVFFLAFKVFMRFKIENYTFFLLSALFPWSWFASSVLISARSLVDNISLIKKVIFPRHYLVASVIFAQLVHLVFSIPILVFFSVKDGAGPSLLWLLGIPILILVQFMFTFGIALIISITNTYFRDIEYLIGVFMNLVFWLTPITYPISAIPPEFRFLLILNPLTGLITAWRDLFQQNVILWKEIGISAVMAWVILFLGITVFRRLERRLDEVL